MFTGDPDQSALSARSASSSTSSLWRFPGLDETSFYAAALYLHAARGSIEAEPLFREPKTSQDIRYFLDHLADCFARSKLLADRRDHVSATAMVRSENLKKITIYIAKNQSEKGSGTSMASEEQQVVKNENEEFAKNLFNWFNQVDGGNTATHSHDNGPGIFEEMCHFNRSRLEYYIEKISDAEISGLESSVLFHLSSVLGEDGLNGWERAKSVIRDCQSYKANKNGLERLDQQVSLLSTHVRSAGQTRKDPNFKCFASKVETRPERQQTILEKLHYVVGKIKYLGRLFTAFTYFNEFCGVERQKEYSFQYELLFSSDLTWDGDAYMRRCESWVGDLGLSEQSDAQGSTDGQTVSDLRTKMTNIIKMNNNKAPIHCEMQLLMHFSRPDAPKCEDYFGCSKRSCWLCWQIISKVSKHTMKHTHHRIYPDWVFPFDIDPSQPALTEGLIATYNAVMYLVQQIAAKKMPVADQKSLVQSSIRRTPASQFNLLSRGPLESGLFTESSITVPGKWQTDVAQALHLPADGLPKDSRLVHVDVYPATILNVPELRFHLTKDGGLDVVFAFECKTNPKSITLDSEIEDYQRAYWKVILFILGGDLNDGPSKWYEMYYRSANQTLSENPHISWLCANMEPQIQEAIPFRGDIFIFECLPGGDHIKFGLDWEFDPSACLQSLEQFLGDSSDKQGGWILNRDLAAENKKTWENFEEWKDDFRRHTKVASVIDNLNKTRNKGI